MSIRTKMVVGLSGIFGCLLLLMNLFIAGNIRTTNEQYINENLIVIENNGLTYAKQILIINSLDNNEESFLQAADEITRQLSSATGNPVAAYSRNGALLEATDAALFSQAKFDDLIFAMQNRSAYTLDTTDDGRTVAYFSYPVTVEGNVVGLLRTVGDYTMLYTQGMHTMNFVTIITVGMFCVALVLSVLLSQSITAPITRLATLSGNIARNVQDNTLDSARVRRQLKIDSRDEIGKLSKDYLNMIAKIDQQVKTINADKEELRRLADYRKELYDSVTHELKTPLTSIRGYAEVLEENGFTDPEFFAKGINHIKEESDRMHSMVVALLEMSKLSSVVDFPKEPVDLVGIAVEVCQAMQFKADKYNDILQLVADNAVHILGNDAKIKEIFINLVDNAIKYGLPGKVITVGVEQMKDSACIYVVNRVQQPVPDGELARLFEPFYQHKDGEAKEEGSAGLGLSICRQLVEQHGGVISMQNIKDNGVVVSAGFPVYRAAQEGEL
ncbi:MAG: HAMP domain-containing sensor histidine kinase [Eubacteriales bacterium]|nr:HAMP domain-containing sensor histidine kinase [Eubacteriales bacterium]